MFIKEIKTKNKKTGKVYIKHALIESVRTTNGPRHRTVMQLGQVKLPKELWPQLIAELESRISGQASLNLPGTKNPKRVKDAVDVAMENFTICTARRVENRRNTEDEEVTTNLSDVLSSKHRSFGAEFVAHSIWEELRMPEKLKALGFTPKERSLSEGIVAGRLISPTSELATWGWSSVYLTYNRSWN
jgi:hypothetical protein